jgi:hypothetical protein
MSEIITFISSVGGSALLSAGLVFLARNLISERLKNAIAHEYNQKLETHKAQLRRDYDKEIEKLKAQLQIAAAERSIRLTRVFDTIAETVATTYAKLLVFQKAVEDYTQIGGHSDFARTQELQRSMQSKCADVIEYFLPHKIYLPKHTAQKIVYFLNTLQMASGAYGVMMASKGNPDATEKNYQRFTEYSKEVSELLALLEEDFQRILGVEERKTDDLKSTNPLT